MQKKACNLLLYVALAEKMGRTAIIANMSDMTYKECGSMTMRSSKKKRLEEKGWKVGSTKEFIGLSDEEESYLEIKIRLSKSFREHRLRRNMTQADVAKLIKSSQSRVAKIEAGDSSVSLDLLVRSLIALGASSRGVLKLISTEKSASAA